MSVPVAGIATRSLAMDKATGGILLFFLIVLGLGAVSISGAYAREGQLEPGVEPDAKMRSRGRRVMIVAAALIIALVTLGKLWWNSDDSAFQRFIYKPLKMTAIRQPGDRLRLRSGIGRLAAYHDR